MMITILMFISCFNSGGSSSLRNTTWDSGIQPTWNLNSAGISNSYDQRQESFIFGSNDVTRIVLRGNNILGGHIGNRSVNVGTYTVSDNTIIITLDSGVIEGKIIGSQVIQIDGYTFTKSK